MKNLPIGIQTLADIIKGNHVYVDKTEYIYKMIQSGVKHYFLSRPRRFGKSLLISTIKEIFSGNKDLFDGLFIYDKIDWNPHPVIHIDFLGLKYRDEEELTNTLNYLIDQNAIAHGLTLEEQGYDKRFRELIKRLGAKGKVVVLVDEYDKPIIDFVDKEEVAISNREILKTFYSNLKGLDEYIGFVFITGVSKFSKVSVFSELNNLVDITTDENYAAMCGYTHEELVKYFNDRLELLTGEKGGPRKKWLEGIQRWYNGYSWDGKQFVYNPHSVLNFFRSNKFANYWFESGTPTMLVKLIKKHEIDIERLDRYRAGEAIFSSFEIDRIHVVSLLYQTGYLTVKEVEPAGEDRRFYILSYPNLEVKVAFMEYLLGDFASSFSEEISVKIHELKTSLHEGELERFFEIIRSLYAGIPYNMFVTDREGYYHTIVYLILKLLGVSIHTEVETNKGRIDAVIETEKYIYIMEFKLDTSQKALNQIKEKKYYETYLSSGKSIKLIGIGIDPKQRNITDYKVERISNKG